MDSNLTAYLFMSTNWILVLISFIYWVYVQVRESWLHEKRLHVRCGVRALV